MCTLGTEPGQIDSDSDVLATFLSIRPLSLFWLKLILNINPIPLGGRGWGAFDARVKFELLAISDN